MRILSRAAAIAFVLAPVGALAEEVGDPQQGFAYALKHCSECHAVETADEPSPNPDAPNFAIVANTQGMSARALAVWLVTSHPTMPNLMIGAEDRDNVIAYIMSLRAQQ